MCDNWTKKEIDEAKIEAERLSELLKWGVLRNIEVIGSAGCVCPVGAEKTCQGAMCPRRPMQIT